MDASAVRARRAAAPFSKQHAGQFTAAVEDRPARVALPRGGGAFDDLKWVAQARSEVLRAAPGLRAIVAAAITGDGELLANLRRLAGDLDRCSGWPLDQN